MLAGAWASIRTFGWETRRLGVTDVHFRPQVSDGLFLQLAVTSVESLACAYAAVLAEAKRYEEASELLDGIEPRQAFEQELVDYVRGVLYFRTGRWPDVLNQFPEGKVWRQPELKAAGAAMATTALASLGVFEEAIRRGQDAIEGDRVLARPTSPCTPRGCACGISAARTRPSNFAPGVFARSEVQPGP